MRCKRSIHESKTPSVISRLNDPDDPIQYDDLTKQVQDILALWISLAIQPATKTHISTSYGQKHEFERDSRIYVVNGAFKGAMLVAGYQPKNRDAQNWEFKIRSTAPRRRPGEHFRGYFPLPAASLSDWRKMVQAAQRAEEPD